MQTTTLYIIEDEPVLPWSEYYGEDTSNDSKVYFWVDPKTSLVKDVSQEQMSVTEVVAEFVYDCFGRLIEATDNTGATATVQKVFNDWLTGNVQFRDDGEQQAESHMPGHTRYTIAEVPEEWRADWLLRGLDYLSSFDHAGGVNLTRAPDGSSRLRDSPPGTGGPA